MLERFRKWFAGSVFVLLFLIPFLYLHSEPASPAEPGVIPSRIILTWSGDPATTQAVTWRTATPLQSAQAQITKLIADPGFVKEVATIRGTTTTDDLGNGKLVGHYAAHFTGLEPDTKYCYRVGDGQTWSEWNSFRTAASKAEPFRFIYFGDAQNNIKSMCSRTFRKAYATAPDARFLVHAGDLVNEGYDDSLWGEWCEALGFIGANVPSLPVVGNHDLHRIPGKPDSRLVLSASPLWSHHFALPDNGPDAEELKSQSYFIDYQGARLVFVDVNAFANEDFEAGARKRIQEKEVEWLNKILGNNPNSWTIIVQHQAIFSIAKNRNYAEMRATLAPLYEKNHVDLVLQGHDHAYGRTHKIAGEQIVDSSAPGIVYAISVCGPKMYTLHDLHRELMAKTITQSQFFQVIEVSPDRLLFTAYSVEGSAVDEFELRKHGMNTTYVDHSKAVPPPSIAAVPQGRSWRTGLLIPDLWAVLEPWVKGHESHDIININGLEVSGGQ